MFNIIVFMGPSGVGKSTIQKLMDFKPIITWTSRAPREGEIDGVHYNFTTKEHILEMDKDGMMLEHTEYNGNLYGTSLVSFEEIISNGQCRSVVLDANGVAKVKRQFADSVLVVGVNAPYEDCKGRLIKRNAGEDETVLRLSTYSEEIESLMVLSDVVINNSDDNRLKVDELVNRVKNQLCNE